MKTELRNVKLFLGVFIFLAYISMGVFGLVEFNRMSSAPMADCPYAENGFAVCVNSLDHINTWQQFSRVTLPSLFTFSFLILGIILYFFGRQNFLNQKQHFYKWEYCLAKKTYTFPNRIIKWLSLLENSPSL